MEIRKRVVVEYLDLMLRSLPLTKHQKRMRRSCKGGNQTKSGTDDRDKEGGGVVTLDLM